MALAGHGQAFWQEPHWRPLSHDMALHRQVLAQGPAADGQPSQTILAGPLYPTNAAALSRAAVPQAAGARLDGGTPYHAFMWPVPDTNSTAAGSISATLYNDSRQALRQNLHVIYGSL